jgi:hypothetical protein
VYRVAETAEDLDYWPAGAYGVAFIDKAVGEVVNLLVSETGIVRIAFYFPGQPFTPRDAADYLLPPLAQAGGPLAVPEVGVVVNYSGSGRFERNPEQFRRGSLVSYDYRPADFATPYLQEIQFFTLDSIRAFTENCGSPNDACHFGDAPDPARYHGQQAALQSGGTFGDSERVELGGRAFLAREFPCVGDTCVIREYTTFVENIKVDVWVVLSEAAQAAQADQLLETLTVAPL